MLMILFLLPATSWCESVNGFLSNNNDIGSICDICSWEDGLAILGTNGIWKYIPASEELTSIFKYREILDSSILTNLGRGNYLFVSDGNLYLFDSKNFICYKVADNQLEVCLEGSREIGFYEDQGEMVNKQCISGIAANSGIYLLLKSMTFADGWVTEMYYLDPVNDNIISYGNQEIDTLYSFTNGQLLAGKKKEDDEEQILYVFDEEKDSFHTLNNTAYSSDAVGFIYDGERLAYIADKGKVIVECDGQRDVAAIIPYEYLFQSSRAMIWGNSYVYLQDGILNLRSLEVGSSETISLKVLGSVSNDIVMQYMAENPNINIVFDYREDTFLGLQEALVSSDNSVDLFLVESDGVYDEIINKGYAFPLTSSEYLMRRVSGLYPCVQNVLIRNNELYGIPVSIYSEYWTINHSMWQQLKMGDYPRTYADVFNAMEIWKEKYADNYSEYSLFESEEDLIGMLRIIIQQYLLIHEDWISPVNFDTEEFRKAVQDLLDHADMFEYDGETLPIIMNYPQYLGTGYNDNDVVKSFVPPTLTLDSVQAVRGTMEILMLSPLSKHSKEALDFLEYYIEHLDLDLAYQVDMSYTEPLRKKDYEEKIATQEAQIEALNKKLEETDDIEQRDIVTERLEEARDMLAEAKEEWLYSPEDIEIYQKIAEKIIIPTHTVYPHKDNQNSDAFYRTIERFVDEGFSVDQLITILNEKSKMIFMEEQQ